MAATIDGAAYIEQCQRSIDRVRDAQLRAEADYAAFQSGVNTFVANMQADNAHLLMMMWGGTFIEGNEK